MVLASHLDVRSVSVLEPARQLLVFAMASDLGDDPRRVAEHERDAARETKRRRDRWGRQALFAAVALGAVGGFAAIARVIRGNNLMATPVDLRVVRALGRTRRPITNAIVRGWTELGAAPIVSALAVASVVKTRHRPRLAAQIALGAVGSVTAELGVKRFFLRKRPTLLSHLERVGSTSFPSGHSMAASSFYLTLALVGSRHRRLRAHRAALVMGAGALASSIATTRVYLGVHWPTDVLAGLALGTAWACATESAFDFAAAAKLEVR